MVSLLNLKWISECQKQLKDLAGDYKYALLIVEALDADPDLRDELSSIYTSAKRTIEAENNSPHHKSD